MEKGSKAKNILKHFTHAIRMSKKDGIEKEEILYSHNSPYEGWFYIGDKKHPRPFGRPHHFQVTDKILDSYGWYYFGERKTGT